MAAKEIAGSRDARGTANRREEKAKNLTADEPAVAKAMAGKLQIYADGSSGRNSGHGLVEVYRFRSGPSGVVLFYSCPFLVNLWTLSSGFESGRVSATPEVAETMRTSRCSSLPMRCVETVCHFSTVSDCSI